MVDGKTGIFDEASVRLDGLINIPDGKCFRRKNAFRSS
jgi:hypothetical protein